MTQLYKSKIQLFITALLQVFFVAMQPLLIVHHKVIPMLICGFLISMIWSFNIRKVAFGDLRDRFIYATGAMIGTGFGYYVSMLIVDRL